MHYMGASTQGRDPLPELYKDLLGYLSNSLAVCGVKCRDIKGISEDVDRRRGDDIKNIIRLTLTARETIGVKIVSKDFEPFVARPGVKFDPEQMEEEFKDRDTKEQKFRSSTGAVACTVEVGLRKCEKRAGESESKLTVPLKAKVILENQIREITGVEEASEAKSGESVRKTST